MDVTAFALTSQVTILPPPGPKPSPDTGSPAPGGTDPDVVIRLDDEVTIRTAGERDDLGSSDSTGEQTPVTDVIGTDSEVDPGDGDDKIVDIQPIDPTEGPKKNKNGKVPGVVRLLNEGHFKAKPEARLRANHAAYFANSPTPEPEATDTSDSIDVVA